MKDSVSISAFDLDYTLIKGNSSANFCRFLYKEKVLPFSALMHSGLYYFRYHLFGMSLKDLHQSTFEWILRGKSLELLEHYADRFVNEYLMHGLYMPAFERLKQAQQLGHYTMILSNSPSFLVKRFAKCLGVQEFRATEYAVDEEKRLAAIDHIFEGEDKASHLEKIVAKLGIIRQQVTAYSDSILDLAFLQAAGHAIAVNPDRKLRAFSLKNQWGII